MSEIVMFLKFYFIFYRLKCVCRKLVKTPWFAKRWFNSCQNYAGA